MRHKILIFGLVLLHASLVCAQKTKEIKMTAISGKGYDECIPAARKKAINAAKKNALNKAGIAENINAYTDLFKAEVDDNYSELFTSQVFTNIRGGVRNIEIIEKNCEVINENNIEYKVVINCKVLKYNVKPDPMYDVEIKGISNIVNEGELLKFNITPTKDSWLHAFCIPENQDKAFSLFPNEYEESFLLKSGKTYELPQNVDIEFSLDENKPRQTDRFIFVLTKQQYPFSSKLSYKNVTDWIFKIPPDQRIVKSFAVDIRKNN